MTDYDRYLKYKNKYMELKGDGRRRQQTAGAKNGPFPIEDESHFWSRQMTEHALFLFLGLEDKGNSLKIEANQLFIAWKKFMKETFWEKGVDPKPDLITLTAEDLQKVGTVDVNDTLFLIDLSEKFQTKLLDQYLRKNEWVGWIFVSLAEHMQKETAYFKRKLTGPAFSQAEEIEFANQHHSEEMGATAQLLDPAPENNATIEKVRSYATKTMANWSPADLKILLGMDVTEQATLLKLSIDFGNELTKFAEETGQKIDNKQLKSIISPILAHHNHREFARFTQTLKSF